MTVFLLIGYSDRGPDNGQVVGVFGDLGDALKEAENLKSKSVYIDFDFSERTVQ